MVELEDGGEVRCDAIVVGTGRVPRTNALGLERAGVELGERGELVVDDHCRAAEGLWGVGDVTGVMPFTHVAKYQARVVADNILGKPRAARYEGIPRVVFTDPEVAAVGLTTRQAEERGYSVAAAEVDLTETIARPWTYEEIDCSTRSPNSPPTTRATCTPCSNSTCDLARTAGTCWAPRFQDAGNP